MTLSILELWLLALSGGVAGLLGAMVGIGGGILIIPLLVLGFGVPVHVAVAASLVAVVATSSAAGSVFVGEGLTNMRLAMTLELATTSGAIAGGLSAALLDERVLAGVFAGFTLLTAGLLARDGTSPEPGRAGASEETSRGYETPGTLDGGYYDDALGRVAGYRAERLPTGLAVSFVAGNVSGLLGVGGGFLKVPAMTLGMRVPIKVAAATSNFMIGVTAAASLVIYYQKGFLYPLVAAPVAVGVAGGALLGTRLASRFPGRTLARLLVVVLLVAAVEMGLRSAGVSLGG